jgi:RNA polymerase sigma-70 factor, ECF subfamily
MDVIPLGDADISSFPEVKLSPIMVEILLNRQARAEDGEPAAVFDRSHASGREQIVNYEKKSCYTRGHTGVRCMQPLKPASNGGHAITALLQKLSEGNREVEADLIPQIYPALRQLAARYMRHERQNHTLQPTALVHEAYERLVQQPQIPWQSRAHFYATASQLMRHILVDHARTRQAAKRGGVQHQVTLDEALLPSGGQSTDILALHEALERLAKFDARQSRIVEMHFFGGLTFEEMAAVLGVSDRTVKRDWSMARAWLKGELTSKRP